jgi:hypothetical protein
LVRPADLSRLTDGADIVDRAVAPARCAGAPARNADAALLLSVASAWAYSDAETLAVRMALCGMRDVRFAAVNVQNGALLVDTQAFFIHSAEHGLGILVFRGTEFGGVTLTDMFTDVNTAMVDYPPGTGALVHAGFHRAFKCAWPQLWPVLRQHLDLQHLYVAGHSLGGALAVLATYELFCDPDLAPLTSKFRGLYTYGQPMVGNAAFAKLCKKAFGKLTFRHVYQHDLVPRLPPRTTGRFQHFGNEYFGTATAPWGLRKGTVEQAVAALMTLPIATVAFAAEQVPALRWIPFPVSLGDHIPQNYVDCSKLRSPTASLL